jgi:hypothetical protein
MSRRIDHKQLVARQEVVSAPPLPSPRYCDDRTFELPPALHIATAGLFLGFVTVLCTAFATPGLLIPYAVFVAFIGAFFAVPGLWTRMKPEENRSKALSWDEFLEDGIDTMTGHTPAREAATLVLILPFLVLCWAVAVASIAAVVR